NLSYATAVRAQGDASQPENEIAPMPPTRPPALAAPAAPAEPQAPAAPQQPPDQQATGDSSTPAWTPGKLLQLPPYTRPRMHECAMEWQKMKESGAATEKIWFTFAQSCLVR
ncbi:MAG: hypothetical protein WAM51_01215, partial [Methylovirgula sp.]